MPDDGHFVYYNATNKFVIKGGKCVTSKAETVYDKVAEIISVHTREGQSFSKSGSERFSKTDEQIRRIVLLCGKVDNPKVKAAIRRLIEFKGWKSDPSLGNAKAADGVN